MWMYIKQTSTEDYVTMKMVVGVSVNVVRGTGSQGHHHGAHTVIMNTMQMIGRERSYIERGRQMKRSYSQRSSY